MTIREWLKQHGGVDRVQLDGNDHLLDFEYERATLVTDGGRLFVSCNGQCIVAFEPFSGRCTVYIVMNDAAGREWESKMRRGEFAGQAVPPRPSPVLRLALPA